ncbi:MAG: chemotaxis protein CheC [Ardenticatenales bacterium]|nr:chemotaxis protein CheC [Ardenticatenales bacterium]
MILTEQQSDSLTELINIAFSRTAAALSDLTGQRVFMDMPEIAIYPIADLVGALETVVPEEITTVHQIFEGPVGGDALLLLDYEGAVKLAEMLTDEHHATHRLDASDREVLTEVGNILLNACLSMFGNILEVHVSFSVPRLRLEALSQLLESLIIRKEGLRYALVAHTAFRLHDSAVEGHLIIVLGVTALDRLLQAVDTLG